MIVKMTQEQVNALFQIVCRASISGNDAEVVAGLKQALSQAEEEKTEKTS